MRIHAIIIALNEEDFIQETIRPLYNNCTGISIITQYDRDYYGKKIIPDSTVQKVLDFPDPEGKVHLVARKFNDETASRNHEMNAILFDASKKIQTHGVDKSLIAAFHKTPDYFLICDADEIYDADTLPQIIEYLKKKKPQAMRVSGYNYYLNWNRREPRERYVHNHFGFVKAGLFFEQRRVLNWNESRLNKLGLKFGFPAIGSRFYNFIECPWEVGMMHHAGYVRRNKEKLIEKMTKHSHLEAHPPEFLEQVLKQEFEFVSTSLLPANIQNGNWPDSFFEKI
jgi:Glycosyl transferase family 2